MQSPPLVERCVLSSRECLSRTQGREAANRRETWQEVGM